MNIEILIGVLTPVVIFVALLITVVKNRR